MTDDKFDQRMEDWVADEVGSAPDLKPTTEMYRLVETQGRRGISFWNQQRWAATASVALAAVVILFIGGLILRDSAAWFRPTPVHQVAFVQQRQGPDLHPEAPDKGKSSGAPLFQQLTLQVHHGADGTIDSMDLPDPHIKGIPLATRDEFRLLIQPAQRRSLYIYLLSPSDGCLALHPESGFNPLHPVARTLLPNQPDWFYLTGENGTYRLIFITASHAIPELDELEEQYLRGAAVPDYESAYSALHEYLNTQTAGSTDGSDSWEVTFILKE